MQPAYDYFHLKFNNDLKPVLDAFKAARLFSPSKFHELKPSAADIDCLKAFPFLNSQPTIDGLKSEIPTYMAASEDVPKTPDRYQSSCLVEEPCYGAPQMGQCFQTCTVSPTIFCCSRENLFNSTALYSSAAVPGTLCYVAIQPCSLDSLICACTLITVCKKRNFWKAKWVKERAKWVNRKSKIGRFIEHKRKAK